MTAYERVEKVIHEQGKACVIHPTGTGKTYIAFKLIEAHQEKERSIYRILSKFRKNV